MFKTLFLSIPFIKKLKQKGYLAKNIRRQLIINFIFQRIFGQNRSCKYSVHFTSAIQVPQKLHIGKNVEKSLLISGHCYIQATNGIFIGDNTIFAPGVKLISSNHDFTNLSIHKKENSIRIGKNCWLGANAIILH